MGNPVSRKGDIDSGHGCFPPRVSITGSPDVFINSIEALRQDDQYGVHVCLTNSHSSTVSGGSATVFVNGKPLARIGDAIACGSIIAQGSANVFAG